MSNYLYYSIPICLDNKTFPIYISNLQSVGYISEICCNNLTQVNLKLIELVHTATIPILYLNPSILDDDQDGFCRCDSYPWPMAEQVE